MAAPRSETYRVLRIFKSRSNPKVKHEVRRRQHDGHTYCTCRGYSGHGHCWHYDKVFANA